MSEDWAAIAQEVEGALAEIGDTSQPDGYPAVLRKEISADNPYDDEPDDPITYHQVVVMVSDKEMRDINGTLIGQTKRTVTISGAAGVVPHDDDQIVLGMTSAEVTTAGDENIAWQEIATVRSTAPAGIAVLYEIDISI